MALQLLCNWIYFNISTNSVSWTRELAVLNNENSSILNTLVREQIWLYPKVLFALHLTQTLLYRWRLFEKVFVDLLHSYYLGHYLYIQEFIRPEKFYYSVITVAFSSR